MTQSNRVSDAEVEVTVTTTVRLPVEMVDAFKTIAARNHRSFAGEIRTIVEAHIASYEAEKAVA